MRKLTVGEVARELGVSTFTVKRWYEFWEILEEDVHKLNDLVQNGMPVLPQCDRLGARADRIWNEDDIEDLKAFRDWVPAGRNCVFLSVLKTREEK